MEVQIKGAEKSGEGAGFIASLKGTSAEDKPAIDGTVKVTGLAMYYAYYAEASLRKSTTEDKASQRDSRGNSDITHKMERKAKAIEGKWIFVGSKTWFDSNGASKRLEEAEL